MRWIPRPWPRSAAPTPRSGSARCTAPAAAIASGWSAYLELFTSVQGRADTLQEAVTRNPDFIYRDEYRVILDAHEYCKEQAEGVREEFERYTRELIQTPTVQEMKKGKPQTLARVDFALLRDAVNALAPEDQGALLTRVDEAEQRVQASAPADSEAKSER